MPPFPHWLTHRAQMLGLAWPDGIHDLTGLTPRALQSVRQQGTLRPIGRSACACLARALKVSLRELEALAAGKISWITDDRIVDLDRLHTAPTPRELIAMACPLEQGTPVLGRIEDTGRVRHHEDWTADDGPRLAARFRGLCDPFALEWPGNAPPHLGTSHLLLQPIRPGELQPGQWAVLTRDPGETVSELWIVEQRGDETLEVTHPIATSKHRFEMTAIVRAPGWWDRGRRHGICSRERTV